MAQSVAALRDLVLPAIKMTTIEATGHVIVVVPLRFHFPAPVR